VSAIGLQGVLPGTRRVMGKRSEEDSRVRMVIEARFTARRVNSQAQGLRVETAKIRSDAAALRKRCLNDWKLLGVTRRN
jgi:translation initiation factor 1 (eIF-1/SUI1)